MFVPRTSRDEEVTDLTDRLRSECEQARARGVTRAEFELDDVEWMLRGYERVIADNLDLISDADALRDRLDPTSAYNALFGR